MLPLWLKVAIVRKLSFLGMFWNFLQVKHKKPNSKQLYKSFKINYPFLIQWTFCLKKIKNFSGCKLNFKVK